jgi:hypothetical protein
MRKIWEIHKLTLVAWSSIMVHWNPPMVGVRERLQRVREYLLKRKVAEVTRIAN